MNRIEQFTSNRSPCVRGRRAVDGLVLVSKADGFFEFKRSRDRRPSFE